MPKRTKPTLTKPKLCCAICNKSYVNLALHHTKTHAVFKCVDYKLYRDGVLITDFETGGDGDDEEIRTRDKYKGWYNFLETGVSHDNKTYRLKLWDDGICELWSTNCIKEWLYGKDVAIISANVDYSRATRLLTRA